VNAGDAYAQGARCGHIEGKGRAGAYVLGEEIDLAWEAAGNQGLNPTLSNAWSQGYEHGYRRAADGLELEPEYAQ
jgi:hypothetical protein